tara:strand:+ start:1165 stop:2016 length:852 start_codon:yes stop_codon:yes gene_type:complete
MLKILVIGITGMLGNTLLRSLSKNKKFSVLGSSRRDKLKIHQKINYEHLKNLDVENEEEFFNTVKAHKPDVIINCIGVIKQLKHADEPLKVLPINSIFPHKLHYFCNQEDIRLIHISTDCVFSGKKGNYLETEISDAQDLYGKSKYIGELHGRNSLTIRTSIIGHEIDSKESLLEWFLSQEDRINGYTNAFFSGLTTLELSNVIENIILYHKDLSGLYHVSSKPISKYDLLNLIKKVYQKKIKIVPSDQVKINRSLNSEKFLKATNLEVSDWESMIESMKNFN